MLNINDNTPLPTNGIYHKNLNTPIFFFSISKYFRAETFTSHYPFPHFSKKLNTDKFIYSHNSLQNGTHASNNFIIFFKINKYQTSSIYTYGNILHFTNSLYTHNLSATNNRSTTLHKLYPN